MQTGTGAESDPSGDTLEVVESLNAISLGVWVGGGAAYQILCGVQRCSRQVSNSATRVLLDCDSLRCRCAGGEVKQSLHWFGSCRSCFECSWSEHVGVDPKLLLQGI